MKCSENSKSQIVFRTDIFRKLSLGAPVVLVDDEEKEKEYEEERDKDKEKYINW